MLSKVIPASVLGKLLGITGIGSAALVIASALALWNLWSVVVDYRKRTTPTPCAGRLMV